MAKDADKPTISKEKNRRMLSVKLTDEEMQMTARAMAQDVQTISEYRANLKAQQSEMGGRIKQLEAGVGVAANRIKNGEEMRMVDIEIESNYTDCTIRITRSDTNVIIEERPMMPDEKQLQMPFEEDDPPSE